MHWQEKIKRINFKKCITLKINLKSKDFAYHYAFRIIKFENIRCNKKLNTKTFSFKI